MIIFIKGPTERKRLDLNEHDNLYKKIQEAFKIDTFTLSYDEENNNKVDTNNFTIKKGMTLFLHYEVIKKDIKRERDGFLCDHPTNVMCANCAPLDPWDSKYMEDKKIKYLSFGSYKEMCKYKNEELVVEDYTIKKCTDHKKNIKCINCQEKDILLNPQRYRMVDHVEFDDINTVDNFIKHWRDTRRQHFGLLIGKYKPYDLVPLGRKALVSAIWLPEQENYPDGFVVNESFEEDFLEGTGLEIVGMIYTDLVYNGNMTSSKLKDDFFLSSLEIDFISKMQFMFPNLENQKVYNSKFVTIIATANIEGEIELMEYQVSSQCMALTRNKLILPTNNPKLYYTKKNIFYKTVEEDATLKTVKAEPFLPVEYFIVRLTHGNKQNPLFENSTFISNTLTNKKIAEYFEEDYSFTKFSNFSLLMKLRNRFSNFKQLLECVVKKDIEAFDNFKNQNDFKEFVLSLQKYYKRAWVCQACTFINEHKLDKCEVCDTLNC